MSTRLVSEASNLSEQRSISLPAPSQLYSLEAVALNTTYTESLTSYICRLAQAHSVPSGILVTKKLAALSQRESKNLNGILGQSSRTVNGFGSIASDIIQATAQLTLRSDLYKLSLHRWFSENNFSKILRLYKAWCPVCYSEWAANSQTIYDPLLWALEVVEICPTHSEKLITNCPHCNELPFPLQWFSRPGYCPKCRKWLGQKKNSTFKISEKELKWQSFLSGSVGNLLEVLSSDQVIMTADELSIKVRTLIDQISHGSTKDFSKIVGVSERSLYTCITKKHVPSLDKILKICFALNLEFSEILLSKNNAFISFSNTLSILSHENSQLSIDQKNQVLHLDRKNLHLSPKMAEVKNFVETLLLEDKKPPSLTFIRQKFNVYLEDAQVHLSQLFNEIKVKRSHYPKAEAIFNRLEVVRNHLISAIYDNSELLPLNNFAVELELSKTSLEKYFPDLCHAYELKRIGKASKYNVQQPESIEEFLLITLKSNDCPPAPFDIASKFQIEESRLHSDFPELCQRISEKRSIYPRVAAIDKCLEASRLLETELKKEPHESMPFETFCKHYKLNSSTIEKWFPEECQALRNRSNEYRKIRRRKNLEQLRQEVQEGIVTLRAQGVHPSEYHVKKFLTKPKYLLDPEFAGIYQEIIEKASKTNIQEHNFEIT